MRTEISHNSPKNKYRGEICFQRPIEGIGSVISYKAMTIEEIERWAESTVRGAKMNAHLVIEENKQTYPKFEWVKVLKKNITL